LGGSAQEGDAEVTIRSGGGISKRAHATVQASGADNDRVPTVVAAEGSVLDRVLDATCRPSRAGLSRTAYGKFHAASMKTAWGRRCQRSFALVEGAAVLASAERYDLTGIIDGRTVRICAVGSGWAEPSASGAAQLLIDSLIDDAAREGAEIALVFPAIGIDVGSQYERLPMTEVTLGVIESPRYGAPMTMVRGGEDRDLAAIVAMGRSRAEPVRFHLDRDVDFVKYAITTRRLLAGLGPAHARALHFFIAEEGITAAAYVIVSVVGERWTLEECGDRDPAGARVGALLQALIAREPIERRPTIHAWLPPRFLPPQITILSAARSADTIGVRRLGSRALMPPLSDDDVLFWRGDVW
jgi:hypothetical protein